MFDKFYPDFSTIHDEISLIQFVIPGLNRNPCFFWIPAFAGMTRSTLINVAMYNTDQSNDSCRLISVNN